MKRLWPSVLVLAAALIAAAVAWLAPGHWPLEVSISTLAACAALAPWCRSMSDGDLFRVSRRQRLDERDLAIRQDAYTKTYVALSLLGAVGLLAVMIEALTRPDSGIAIGIHAGLVIMLGAVVLSTVPPIVEALHHQPDATEP